MQNGQEVGFQPKQNGNLQHEVAIKVKDSNIREAITLWKSVGALKMQKKPLTPLAKNLQTN